MGLDRWRDSSSWTWRERFFVVQELDLFPVIFICLVSRKCEHKSGKGVNNTTHSNSRVHSAQLLHLVIVSLRIHSALSLQQPHVHPTQSSFFVGLRSAHFLTSFALTLSLTSFELACIEKTSAAQPTRQNNPVQPNIVLRTQTCAVTEAAHLLQDESHQFRL